jgi:hypothetical protein
VNAIEHAGSGSARDAHVAPSQCNTMGKVTFTRWSATNWVHAGFPAYGSSPIGLLIEACLMMVRLYGSRGSLISRFAKDF